LLGTAVVAAALTLGGAGAASAASSLSWLASTASAAPVSAAPTAAAPTAARVAAPSGSAVPLPVASDDPADATELPGARLTRSCARIPARIATVEKLRTRLHADAGTRGSLAFLQARLDRANAAGRTDRARLLGDRLALRKDLDAGLPDVLTRLTDAKAVCDRHPSPSSSRG
jgi:hypothetical protein